MTVAVGVRPKDGEYDDPRFSRGGRELLAAFRKRFDGRFSTITTRESGGGRKKWIEAWDARTTDRELLLDVHRWLQGAMPETIEAFARARIGSKPDTIVHARWVELLGDVRDVGTERYEVACRKCGRLAWNVPPNPFPVSDAVLKAPKSEIFREYNAVFVVSSRVYEILNEHARGEFDSGEVSVAGHPECREAYRWVRPVHHIGDIASWYWCDPCPKCGIPNRREMRYDEYPRSEMLLRSFGKPEWNMARIGDWPFVRAGRREAQPRPSMSTVVSGGLFAALYNEGAKGLVWPDDGPFLCVDSHVPVLEAKRRFDVYAPPKDRILKAGAK